MTTTTEQAAQKGLSPQEAFVTLLIAAARADGTVSAHEANTIEHTVSGMKLFRDHGHESLHAVVGAAVERIKQDGLSAVVKRAAAAIPKTLAATMFAVAVDLMLADGLLSDKEESFTDELRALLNVETDEAAKIVDVLRTKNAG
jgi:uncharacterized membrane protein YebE (DUF533 family)